MNMGPRGRGRCALAWLLAVAIGSMGPLAAPSTAQVVPAGRETEAAAQAVELVANGRAGEAEDLLRDAVATKRDPVLLVALGNVLIERANALEATSDLGRSLRRGILEEALALHREAETDVAQRVHAAIGAATCHVLLQREQEAEATLRDAIARPCEDAAARSTRRLLLGELVRFLALRDRVDEAQAVIDSARSANDLDDAQVVIERMRVRAARGDREGLHAAVLQAAADGADPFELSYLAWNASGDGEFEKKLFLYSALLERVPSELAYRYYRGATRLLMGDAAGAVSDLEPCILDPRFGPRARSYLGRALLTSGKAEAALPHFDELLKTRGELTQEALDGIVGVAVARARARRFTEALELYERVLVRDPTNFWSHVGRPLCHKSLGNVERAIAAYEAGLAARPDEPQLLNDFGLLLHAQGERARARQLFERALAGGSADGGENLGIFAFQDDHDPRVAAGYFARTLALDPSRARVRFYRELCLADAPP